MGIEFLIDFKSYVSTAQVVLDPFRRRVVPLRDRMHFGIVRGCLTPFMFPTFLFPLPPF